MTKPKSPSETITDKLCRHAQHRLAKRLEVEYEKHFPYVGAGDEFFVYLDKWEARVMERLAKRPLTRAEVNSIEASAFKAIRAKMLAIAPTVEQPQFQECVNIATGETRLIPKVE